MGASSEREALGRHYFPGEVETRLLQLSGAKLGTSEGRRAKVWGGLWTGGSRLKLDLETQDGAGNKQVSGTGWAFKKLQIYESTTQSKSVSCFTTA